MHFIIILCLNPATICMTGYGVDFVILSTKNVDTITCSVENRIRKSVIRKCELVILCDDLAA